MAKREQFKMGVSERRRRHFSDSFKAEKVREMEAGITRPYQIHRMYEVSYTSISRWMSKFGSVKSKKERVIVETASDTARLLELRQQVAELERMLGQKQIVIDFQEKMIGLAEEHYGVDIKKKFSGKP